jgi:hypothetical protein
MGSGSRLPSRSSIKLALTLENTIGDRGRCPPHCTHSNGADHGNDVDDFASASAGEPMRRARCEAIGSGSSATPHDHPDLSNLEAVIGYGGAARAPRKNGAG